MNKQLTEEQIQRLHGFCEKHYVPYYDLQVELVDHLASAIENRWEQEPELNFEKALYETYSKFGVAGFSKVKMEKEKELRQKYSRLQRRYIVEFFKLPKIILTFSLGFFLYYLFRYSDNPFKTSLVFVLAYILFMILFLFVFYPKKLQLRLEQNKPFLLYQHYRSKKWSTLLVFFGVINLLSLFRNFDDEMSIRLSSILISSSLTLFIIASIVTSIYLPQKIKDDFLRKFPQFVKA